MNCREFRAQHCAFVDDTLSLADMAAMRAHLEGCAGCSHHDTRVRRSLLVVRNSPELTCSSDFNERLQARIRQIGPIDRCGTQTGSMWPTAARFSSVAAGVVAAAAVATLATAMVINDRSIPEVHHAPVIASIPERAPTPLPVNAPAYVASVMSGMPIWSAVMVAGESSVHAANYEFQLVGY